MGSFRALIRDGKIEPLGVVSPLPEGAEAEVVIMSFYRIPDDPAAFTSSFGAWRGSVDADALIRNIRESRNLSTRPEPRL